MAQNRARFRKQLQEGLNTTFGLAYDKWPDLWPMMFATEESNKAFEEDTHMAGMGYAPEKSEGAALFYDQMTEGGTARYTHVTIAYAGALTQEAEEDGLYGSLGKKMVRSMARGMKATKEVRGAAVYNNGHDTNFTGFDGRPLFATDHPLTGGGTETNRLSAAADLAIGSMEDLLIIMRNLVDDRGIPVMARAQKLILPPELEYIGERVLNSSQRPGTMDNDINAVKSLKKITDDPCINPYLTSPNNWYIMTDVEDGVKHFRRIKLQKGIEGDFDTGNMRYKCRERYSFGFTDWRGAVSNGI